MGLKIKPVETGQHKENDSPIWLEHSPAWLKISQANDYLQSPVIPLAHGEEFIRKNILSSFTIKLM